jgi:large subunit ribosomal protein L10
VLSTAEVESLADLPSRARIAGAVARCALAPATKLVRILNEPASALARLLNAKAEKEGNLRRLAA